MVHYSKKDWWLVAAPFVVSMIPLTLGAVFLFMGITTYETGRLLIVAGAVIGMLQVLVTYPLYYRITSSELIIRCGILMRRHIPLSSIDEVESDRNPIGSPAWSLDRLRVDYRKNGDPASILISPKDKLAFIQELASTDTDLKVKGDRLIREPR
ncbi:MAG: PH domain-containing protein [Acidobacteriota bacterium]